MARIISFESTKRGTTKIKVETTGGEAFIMGFNAYVSPEEEPRYSSIICSIYDDYDKMSDVDMLSFISLQMARAKMETPMFIMPDRNEERTRIGKKIRSLREERGMEARTLARLSDIDPANLCRIESGKFSAGLDTLSKIALALDSKVDIISKGKKSGKNFQMKKNIWVLPTGDYLPIATIPAYGFVYWPKPDNVGIHIGDIVATYHNGNHSYCCCFVVAEDNLCADCLNQVKFEYGFPGPDENADSFIKLNYQTGLSSTEEAIIFDAASRQLNGEPQKLTLLEGDIL